MIEDGNMMCARFTAYKFHDMIVTLMGGNGKLEKADRSMAV